MIEQPELKIKQLRELKNFTQEYVASQLGLSTRAYSKIESGETQLTINRLNEISSILGISPIEILGFDDKNIFNIYNSSDINNIKNINFPEKLVEQYEATITSLKEQIEIMKLLMEK